MSDSDQNEIHQVSTDGIGSSADAATADVALATPDRTGGPDQSPVAGEWTIPVAVGVMQLAGLTSIGAGAIHAAAAGQHGEVTSLARLFVAVAAAQLAVGLLALVRGGKLAASLAAAVNAVAVGAWAATRLWDINWVAGLEQREDPQFMDAAAAALGSVAVLAAVIALAGRRTAVSRARIGVPGLSVGVIAVVAMLVGANHSHAGGDHAHGDEAAVAATDPAVVAGGASALATAAVDDHPHPADEAADGHDHAVEAPSGAATEVAVEATAWPRPWDPAVGLDFSGVPGVTREQQLRAAALVNATLRDLPAFADVSTLGDLGYSSIGDAATGFEHYINYDYIADDRELDPTAPESLVFRVDGAERTLVSAMFIIADTPVDDPRLVDYGGPLMQWHTHENLCWTLGEDGSPRVAGVADVQEDCPAGSVLTGGGNPMVHVWITPHECGPFAALEGHGAGQTGSADGVRTDQCAHGHDDGGGSATAGGVAAEDQGTAGDVAGDDAVEALATPRPWDPTQPIDLSGIEGVTPEQQAFAENLVASNLTDLPQWSDPAVAEAAGFRSIGDGATGHEHFINWDWINDDVYLDPDFPESLVYEPQPDGSRQLVSAMYMLPDDTPLDEVPDWGGALMQWHIHSDLCFNMAGDAPRVAGLTDAQGECTAPLEKLPEAPMIHVWLTPNPCGPFAALEGVGAGQVQEGEEHFCDEAHGSH
ncbi:hypothetical protein [Desertimonas flava]|uniref:hypothetical protein n=1 Tax=Desertimonas flava TaxID=2064846 RepID=UPI001877ACC9|nr:hypothetical protein [Desertimonas flava]